MVRHAHHERDEKVCCWFFIVDREALAARELFFPLAKAPSRGKFDLDLRAEGAGDFFQRRQRQPIVSSPLQTRDVGLLHAAPPRELRLGPAFLQSGSDQNLRENLALTSPHCWQTAARTSLMTLTWPP